MGQMVEDQRLPFGSEYKQGGVQAANKGSLFHLDAILELALTKRCILEERNARAYVSSHHSRNEDAMSRLEGKIAVITGSNSGIGLASAKRFVAEGAHVYITGRRQDELDKAVEAIGSGVTAVQGDVSNLEDLDRLFAKVRSDHGRIDVLFANAGLGALEPLGKITVSSFDLVFGANVKGTIFTVQKGLPLMRDGGSIILTGSTTASMGTPAFSIYSASKAAIRNLARSWTLDLKGTGIRVNVLSPGATATPGLLNGLARTGRKDAVIAGLIEQTPLRRMADPDDIADVALFLASDDSRSMTASEIFADGGMAQI
jgi:NAD(P)-dependent dehydrogenase (short-subunit alcohol dehydrogenase family)